jgi:hypothetical protein
MTHLSRQPGTYTPAGGFFIGSNERICGTYPTTNDIQCMNGVIGYTGMKTLTFWQLWVLN